MWAVTMVFCTWESQRERRVKTIAIILLGKQGVAMTSLGIINCKFHTYDIFITSLKSDSIPQRKNVYILIYKILLWENIV